MEALGLYQALLGYGAGKLATKHLGNAVLGTLKVKSPVASMAINGTVGGGAGGYAGGFTAGYILSGGDLEFALESGWNGLKSGSITGFGVGTVSGYGYVRQQGINPWTGEVEGGGRVFWSSGGNPAVEAAARQFATKNGLTTLEMTRAGQSLTNLTKGMSWAEKAPMWNRLSAQFARGARGNVHVFQNSGGIGVGSTFGKIEYPILRGNNANIIYHNMR